MRYGILGATGPTGLQLLNLMDNREHSVYVRSPQKLPEGHKAQVVQGALNDTKKLKEWAQTCDVVFCALGHGLSLAQIRSNVGLGVYPGAAMIQDAIKVLLDAGVRRIVHCSAYGTRETRGELPFIFGRIFLPLLIKQSYADHEAVEELLEKSKREWVVVRPTMLTNGPAQGQYLALQQLPDGQHSGTISRADVAGLMLRAAETDEFLGRFVGQAYAAQK